MSDEPKYFNEANKKLWEAADEYFARAGDDSFENTKLARSMINRLGEALILVGFSWVAEAIDHEGAGTVKLALYGAPEAILDLRIFVVAESRLSQLKDMVNVIESKAGPWLISGISTDQDEDVIALQAILLVQMLPDLTGSFSSQTSKALLTARLHNTEGASCKMAIAWALYNLGNKSPWEDLVYGDYFLKHEFVKYTEQIFKIAKSKLKKTEIKDLVCRTFATGDYPDFLMVPEPAKRSVLRVLALDIASDGKANSSPKWTRKPKKNK